jgi:hypothetical protein
LTKTREWKEEGGREGGRESARLPRAAWLTAGLLGQ